MSDPLFLTLCLLMLLCMLGNWPGDGDVVYA